jgi:Transposase IS116/IS110/IS902 family
LRGIHDRRSSTTTGISRSGVARRSAEVIIAETGGDMSAFPTAKHLASWAGVSRQRPVRRQTPIRQDPEGLHMLRATYLTLCCAQNYVALGRIWPPLQGPGLTGAT